ncbi:MAG: SGNH/GDSL hydrolase family protein [Pseudomonadota bacterium]
MATLVACNNTTSKDALIDPPSSKGEILVLGDSMLAFNSLSGRSAPDVLSKSIGRPVTNRAVSGARMIYRLPISGAAGLSIPKQYRKGNWDWVVLNGGGNDLWLGCGCHSCDRKLDKLLDKDGNAKGEIAKLTAQLRNSGAKVLWVGYLRTPGRDSPIEECADEGNELERRLTAFAAKHSGVHFLSIADLVPNGDLTFHGLDRIHPSIKGSDAIGKRIASKIRSLEE